MFSNPDWKLPTDSVGAGTLLVPPALAVPAVVVVVVVPLPVAAAVAISVAATIAA